MGKGGSSEWTENSHLTLLSSGCDSLKPWGLGKRKFRDGDGENANCIRGLSKPFETWYDWVTLQGGKSLSHVPTVECMHKPQQLAAAYGASRREQSWNNSLSSALCLFQPWLRRALGGQFSSFGLYFRSHWFPRYIEFWFHYWLNEFSVQALVPECF